MSDISTWSPNAAQNNEPAPDGFPEGQTAGSVNNSSRELMAAVRRDYEDKDWTDWGHAVTRTEDDTFTVSGDLVSIYEVGRRVRVTGTTTGTIYGTITSSTHDTGTTTVVAAYDSGVIAADSDLTASVGTSVEGSPLSPASLSENPTKMLGEVFMWAGTSAPVEAGATYAPCDGTVLNASLDPTYQPLYDLIGNTYGGSDNTDFQLPDTRSRAVVGEGQGSGLTNRPLGSEYGAESITVGKANLPNITLGTGNGVHDRFVCVNANISETEIDANAGVSNNATAIAQSNRSLTDVSDIPLGGSGTPISSSPPSIALNYYIRTK